MNEFELQLYLIVVEATKLGRKLGESRLSEIAQLAIDAELLGKGMVDRKAAQERLRPSLIHLEWAGYLTLAHPENNIDWIWKPVDLLTVMAIETA